MDADNKEHSKKGFLNLGFLSSTKLKSAKTAAGNSPRSPRSPRSGGSSGSGYSSPRTPRGGREMDDNTNTNVKNWLQCGEEECETWHTVRTLLSESMFRDMTTTLYCCCHIPYHI